MAIFGSLVGDKYGDILSTSTIVLICICIYWLNSLFAIRNTTTLPTKKRFLLVVAHPDDECMFFSPCLLGLQAAGNSVSVLCLSTGDADGLGKVREKELQESCRLLGCSKEDVHLRQHDSLPDSMSVVWESRVVARELATFLKTKKLQFDAFITFDDFGVSGHPNHTSILPGLKTYISSLPKSQAKPDLWKLLTTSLIRKYSGVLDAMPSLTLVTFRVALTPGKKSKKKENFMTFMSDPRQSFRGQRAMAQGHGSQMRWFRWFWVVIGRYMYINELKKVLA